MQDKIQQAKEAGYSDEEIVKYLSQSDDRVKTALDSGYKPEEVVSYLSKQPTEDEKPDDRNLWEKYRDTVGGATIAVGKGIINAVRHPIKSAKLAVRSTADLPMGVAQASLDQPEDAQPMYAMNGKRINDPNEEILSDTGKSALAWVARQFGSGIEGSDISSKPKDVVEAIGNVAHETSQQEEDLGGAGTGVRALTQGFQIPIGGAKWVGEGARLITKVGAGAASGAVAGGTAGYFQPREEKNYKDRQGARYQGRDNGAAAGALLSGGGELVSGTAKSIRGRFTKAGAEERVAREFQNSFDDPNLNSPISKQEAIGNLDDAITRQKEFNQAVPPGGTKLELNTSSAIGDTAALDKYNAAANEHGSGDLMRGSVDRIERQKNRALLNTKAVQEATDSLRNPNAATDAIESEAKGYLDNFVENANQKTVAAKIVEADKNISPMKANKLAGDYIDNMFEASDNHVKELYNKIPDKPVDATELSDVVSNMSNEAGAGRYLKKFENVKKLIRKPADDAAEEAGKIILPDGTEKVVNKASSKTAEKLELSAQDISKANAEMAQAVNKAYNEKNYEAVDSLLEIKDNIRNFLEKHGDTEISGPANEAAAFTKEYRHDALRRGGKQTPGIGQDIRGYRNNPETVTNESMLPQNFLGTGDNAPIETAQDLQRLISHHEKNFDASAYSKAEQNERQRLYSNLINDVGNNPQKGKYETFMNKYDSSFEAFPNLKKEFTNLTDEMASRQGAADVAGKFANKDSYKTVKTLLNDDLHMQGAVALTENNPTARQQLRDKFADYVNDMTYTTDGIKNIDKYTKYFTDGTQENKIIKKLFVDDQKAYDKHKLIAGLLKDIKADTTLSAETRQSLMNQGIISGVAEAALNATGSVSNATASKVLGFLTRLSDKERLKVVEKLTESPEYAKQLLEMNPGRMTKGKLTLEMLEKSLPPLPGAAGELMSPKPSEGELRDIPTKTPNDIKVEEKRREQKVEVKPAEKSSSIAEKFKSDPIKYQVASMIQSKTKGMPAVVAEAAINIANSESELGKKPSNKDSTAKGVFHIIDGTAKDIAKKLKRDKYDMMNNDDNTSFGIQYIKDNYDAYKSAYNKEPKAWELKAMHVLGAEGFKALKSRENEHVAVTTLDAFKKAAKANKNIFLSKNKNKSLTPKQVLTKLQDLYETSKVSA